MMGKNEKNVFDEIMLNFTKLMTLLEHKYATAICIANLLFWIGGFLLQGVYCFTNITFDNWMQYGPLFFACLYFICLYAIALYIILKIRAKVEHEMRQLSWDIRLMSAENKNKVLLKSKSASRIITFVILMLMFVIEMWLKDIIPNISDYAALYDFAEKNTPALFPILLWATILTLPFVTVMINISIFYLYYVAVVFEVQLIILMDYLRNLSLKGPIDNGLVEHHLVVAIDKHHAFMRCFRKVRDLLYVPSILMALGGTVIVTCFSFLIASSTFRVLITYCNFFGTIATLSVICHELQTLEDMSDDFSKALYDTKWYLWNRKNMKTLAIFSILASKPLLWSLTLELQINHGYLRKIMGLIYTLENFLRSIAM